MKANFELFGYEFGLMLSGRKKRKAPIGGITNRTKDGMYVVFLDYDMMPQEWVTSELLAIQKEFKLSDFLILQSSKESFHAVTFDKVTRERYEQILHRSSCDPGYKKVPWIFGRRVNVLRVTEKKGVQIRHVDTLKSDFNVREKSLAHAQFFCNMYSLPLPNGRYDGGVDLIMARYSV